jgi:prevent-host-death family protein
MTMIVVNIHEVKAKLSEYLEAAAKGEHVVICKRNQPVAELRPVAKVHTKPRPIGLAKGQFVVPPGFFDPLPGDLISAFEGDGPRRRTSRVAEHADKPYGTGRRRRL